MPTGATHPYVSKPNDPTLHLALWHKHVVAGHGGPVPLALRKSTWKHRGVIPPVCMHHGGGAAHLHYLWCVFFLFILVVKAFSLGLLICTRATPHTRRTNHAMDFGCAGRLAGLHPGGTSRTAGKTTLLTLRRRKIADHRKSGEKTPRTHKGRTLDESEPVDR